MPNPFYCCTPIHDPKHFVGRGKELERIFSSLDITHTDQMQSVSVVGPRRIGRSSLLLHVIRQANERLLQSERTIFAYVDLQKGQYATQHGLLNGILDLFVEALPQTERSLRQELKRDQKDRELSLAEFEAAITKFQTIPDAPFLPVVCLDEFEQLVKYPEQFPQRLFDSWRSLIGDGKIAFVIASTHPLYELAQEEKLTSQFFNIFGDFIQLGELTEAEAYRLAEQGRKCDRPFIDEDIHRVLDWGGNHALKIQQAGKAIYQGKGQPNVEWDKEKKAYETRIRQTFGLPTRRRRLGNWLGEQMEILGQTILFWKGAEGTDKKVLRRIGIIAVILLICLLIGLFVSPLVRQWVMVKMEFPTPTPTSTSIPPTGTPTP